MSDRHPMKVWDVPSSCYTRHACQVAPTGGRMLTFTSNIGYAFCISCERVVLPLLHFLSVASASTQNPIPSCLGKGIMGKHGKLTHTLWITGRGHGNSQRGRTMSKSLNST